MRLILILTSLMSGNHDPRIFKGTKYTLGVLIEYILTWTDQLYLRYWYLLNWWYIFRWNVYRLHWRLTFIIYLRWGLKNPTDLLIKCHNLKGWLRFCLSFRCGRRSNINRHPYRPDLLFVLGDELKTTLGVILIIHHIELYFSHLLLLTKRIALKHCNPALSKLNHTILSLLSSLLGIHN